MQIFSFQLPPPMRRRLTPTDAVARKRSLPKLAEGMPQKDQSVLAAAIQLGCNVLLTGDRAHLGQLYGQTISGVTIHSPASLAETLFPG